jgi:hypothetical protein
MQIAAHSLGTVPLTYDIVRYIRKVSYRVPLITVHSVRIGLGN